MSYTVDEIKAPSFQVTERGTTATRTLHLTPWSALDEYMQDLYDSGAATGGSPYRPAIITFPGRPLLVLKSADFKPFNDNMGSADSNGVATCESGIEITLQYSTVDYETQDQNQNASDPTTWLSWDVDVQQQVITHAQSSLEWENAVGGSKQVESDVMPAYPVSIVNHTLTWHRVPDAPIADWVENFVGRCNSASFLGHGAETCLFAGFNRSQQRRTDGTRESEVKMTFQARIINGTLESGGSEPIGWNHFLRKTGKWDRILAKDTGDKVVPLADLNDIFSYS